MDAEDAGNKTTEDSYLGVITNDTIAEITAAIIEIVINPLRFDQIYVIKSVESKLNRCLCFPIIYYVLRVTPLSPKSNSFCLSEPEYICYSATCYYQPLHQYFPLLFC